MGSLDESMEGINEWMDELVGMNAVGDVSLWPLRHAGVKL